METPFFFRKKFLGYYGLFVLLLLVVGIVLTTVNYFKAKAEGPVRWEYITVPMSFPIIGLAGYVLILPMWLVHKAREFRNREFSRIPEMFTPPTTTLLANEVQYGDTDQVSYTPPGGQTILGEIRFTNQRLLFTKSIDLKRLTEPLGKQKPDLTSIPLNKILKCGFGLNDQYPDDFVVFENAGNIHTFSSIVKFNADIAFTQLAWKRQRINELVHWIR